MLKQSVIDNMKEIAEHCMGEETAACVATMSYAHKCKRICSINPGRERRRAIKLSETSCFYRELWERICAHPCEGKMQMERREESYGDCILKKICSRSF